MSPVLSGPSWDDAWSPRIAHVVRKYEADWRSSALLCPDPRDYLSDAGPERHDLLTALLRADLVLSYRAGKPRPIEWYRAAYPELDNEALVALIYEEYCLREEAGESLDAAEYQARFPEVSRSFQEVVEIHDLVGRPSQRSRSVPRENGPPFPEAGQTIVGFRLVEELGRGAFARVFLAEEQYLADRPVALKVSRSGSREPQTLARLQHTHIVPVYSSRVDPLTGLHLLCMPYLGRVTLLQILHHPGIRSARTGGDILSILDGLGGSARPVQETSSRATLGRLGYARAIAWWGARMAEALAHAHERGVLHRDVKPSNVLVTTDGLPKLVDFNLAGEIEFDQPGAELAVGGTLAYMAPERLLALAEGRFDPADARSDIYALGVVLFDCLVRVTGAFALPSTRSTITDSLLAAASARRTMPVRIRLAHPDVPAALEAVVNRCLAPEPADRYSSASDLAADLQAVADDTPLRTAREPLPSRLTRWLRRNRRRLAVATPLLFAVGATTYTLLKAERAATALRVSVSDEIDHGRRAHDAGQFDRAVGHFNTALRLAEGSPRLHDLRESAQSRKKVAEATKEARERVDDLFAEGDSLRFLLRFGRDASDAYRSVQAALARFSVPSDLDWDRQPLLERLDRSRHTRLLSEVNELLFLWAWALLNDAPQNRPAAGEVVKLCDAAQRFAVPLGPWQAIRQRAMAILQGETPRVEMPALASHETSARGAFQWALVFELDGDRAAALAYLERATSLKEDEYWYWTSLGEYHFRNGQTERALRDYTAALVLRPDLPYARYDRARIYQRQGELQLALEDLNRARASTFGADFLELRLTLGSVKQALGDETGARTEYEAVIAARPGRLLTRTARVNRASLDWHAGFLDRARAEYNYLLDEDPRDADVRRSRALLALQTNKIEQADADLTLLLRDDPEHADQILAHRAIARLALGRLQDAEADAAGAYRRKPTPSRERLWLRALLALRRADDLFWIAQPEDLMLLPACGPGLFDDLRATIERLGAHGIAVKPPRGPALAHRSSAVLQSALGDRAAVDSSNRAVALSPESAEAYLVRARIRRLALDRKGAQADVDFGLSLAPFDPRLLELRGILKSELGNPDGGLKDVEDAIVRGAPRRARQSRATILAALGRNDAAVREWTSVLEDDPEDPQAYLGRAIALLRLGFPRRALVDLEAAADWASDNPLLLSRVTLAYIACLGSSPERLPRWLRLVRRTWAAYAATGRSARSKA